MFGLKLSILNPNLLKKNINLKLVVSKILNIAFIVTTVLLSHINVALQFTSVQLNLSESLYKHKGYKYTNVIFRAVICFNIVAFK